MPTPWLKNPQFREVPTSLVTRLLEAKQRLVDESYDYDRNLRTYGVNTSVIREVLVELQSIVKDVEFKLGD